ncbi:alpha/beta fold hydrolase [Herminiimonas sp. NPDC097707]|uniref:alpha/beta fold hydrolase n=1 Tax=Herminiimonas sp. NPDC097707 TaxID=3364007 RepID=UPI00383AB61A
MIKNDLTIAGLLSASASTTQTSTPLPPTIVYSEVHYQDYKFKNGQTLNNLRLHYATMGTPLCNTVGEIDNAVLVLHWTANSSAQVLTSEYQETLFAAGKPLDANKYFLIFPDNIGHGKSSKPSDGLHAHFPQYGYEDIVEIQHRLITETLGIRQLHAILGMSMGGMNAWQWAVKYPDAVQGIMPVVTFPKAITGRNLLWRTIVISGIRNDPSWNGGNYTKQPDNFQYGYLLLRMMIDSVPRIQTLVPDPNSAEKWIESVKKESTSADANNVLYALESSRDYNPEPGLNTIKAKVFALNVDDDEFNPNALQILQNMIKQVPNGSYHIQKSTGTSPGHLIITRPSLWSNHVRTFMESLEQI